MAKAADPLRQRRDLDRERVVGVVEFAEERCDGLLVAIDQRPLPAAFPGVLYPKGSSIVPRNPLNLASTANARIIHGP